MKNFSRLWKHIFRVRNFDDITCKCSIVYRAGMDWKVQNNRENWALFLWKEGILIIGYITSWRSLRGLHTEGRRLCKSRRDRTKWYNWLVPWAIYVAMTTHLQRSNNSVGYKSVEKLPATVDTAATTAVRERRRGRTTDAYVDLDADG